MDAERIDEARWWRVELNKAGNVSACQVVEKAERSTRTVLYIRAISRDDALEEAERFIERRREWSRQANRRMRAKKKSLGQCEKCTDPTCAESKVYCQRHLEKAREYRREYDAVERRATKPDPVSAWANETAYRERYRRMAVQLPIILTVFDQLDGRLASRFRRWLVDEITERGGEARAAQ